MIKSVKYKTRLELLSSEQVNAIHQASLCIMERTGLVMPISRARQDQARDLGLEIDTDTQRVYFPPRVVEAASRHTSTRAAALRRPHPGDHCRLRATIGRAPLIHLQEKRS